MLMLIAGVTHKWVMRCLSGGLSNVVIWAHWYVNVKAFSLPQPAHGHTNGAVCALLFICVYVLVALIECLMASVRASD